MTTRVFGLFPGHNYGPADGYPEGRGEAERDQGAQFRCGTRLGAPTCMRLLPDAP